MLLTTALIGAALLQPATATAQAPTCQGKPVTVDGTGATHVVGTEGADVIYSDTAGAVDALGGDDLICIAGDYGNPIVRAGAGNDVVDATAATGTTTFLGEGDDTFHGSSAHDDVTAGSAPYDDAGTDVIWAGPGIGKRDTVHTGQPGHPNSDEIHGGHIEVTWHGSATGTGVLDGGADSLLRLQPETWGMSINTNLGVLGAARWPANQAISGFTDFSVQSHPGLTHFAFRGDVRDESLSFDGLRRTTLFQVGMRGGNDELTVISADRTHRNASFSGGRGGDWLALVMPTVSDVDLDLARGRLSTGRGTVEETVAARGFEDATVVAPDVELVGTGAANDLRVNACRARVAGRGGRDRISALVTGSSSAGDLRCRDGRRMRFLGGSGADRLLGSGGPDLLVGGRGRDRADGARGRDTCDTEVRRSCEARR